jgi:transcriptional regulator with XRE-family HTH domain
MSFGARLAEERKRLGLKQSDFAGLVGTDVPKQSLYEHDRRELRAEYLARLVEADVDVIYILSGHRSDGEHLGAGATSLISAYLALPPELRVALEALACTIRDQFSRTHGATVHTARTDYRPPDPTD